MTYRERALTRFRSRIQQGGEDDCWNWKGVTDRDGYGVFWFVGPHDKPGGRNWRAHRAAYELMVGTVPTEQVVRHRCDNPLCCNPRHLLLGSHADNVADRQARNRTARGDRVGVKRHPERYVGVLVGRTPGRFAFRGQLKTISELAELSGRPRKLVAQRIGKGCSAEQAIAPPDLRFSRKRGAA